MHRLCKRRGGRLVASAVARIEAIGLLYLSFVRSLSFDEAFAGQGLTHSSSQKLPQDCLITSLTSIEYYFNTLFFHSYTNPPDCAFREDVTAHASRELRTARPKWVVDLSPP